MTTEITESTDWCWCFEQPKEAAKYIDTLLARVDELEQQLQEATDNRCCCLCDDFQGYKDKAQRLANELDLANDIIREDMREAQKYQAEIAKLKANLNDCKGCDVLARTMALEEAICGLQLEIDLRHALVTQQEMVDLEIDLFEERLRTTVLQGAIITCLNDNRHLTDGDNCTLQALKDAVPEWEGDNVCRRCLCNSDAC